MKFASIIVAVFVPRVVAQDWWSQDHNVAPWECHHYVGDQQETNWCASNPVEGGYEYKYTEGGVGGPCFPCWCCRRVGEGSTSPVVRATAPASTSKKPPSKLYEHYPVSIAGMTKAVLVGEAGSASGDELTVQHGAGFTLFNSFQGEWQPQGMTQLKLMGKAIKFTVDLSHVGCACNLAFYLISAPARGWDGHLSAGTDRGGQPPYYCDANQVGGQWCPEVDIMEANNNAFAATPHKCDAAVGGHYNYCDRGGCSQNTRDKQGSYGPGSEFTINTRQSFDVSTAFLEDSGHVLIGMRTILTQASKQVELHHSDCSADYIAQLSAAMTSGMSLRITYWGDKASTMSWMDAPPCSTQACNGANAGKATISNISIGSIPKLATTPAPGAESSTDSIADGNGGTTTKIPFEYVKGTLPVQGFSATALVAGDGGNVEGDRLIMKHNSGFSLFTAFEDNTFEASNLAQLKLLGKSISFEVDLSNVGCACNIAFYLISAPARGVNGELSRGTNRGGQPPYYCDANQVGGQWCPEVDIMEANSAVFSSTPHKCDPATNGHYDNCDRSGCGDNSRDEPDAYGPGSSYTIDTRKPFEVRTEFPASGSELKGMRTILSQSGKEVTMMHSTCQPEYFVALSEAMVAGMSLRITYWGDRAETMSWLDSPPCGPQACTGDNAGPGIIYNVTINHLPPPADMWVVSDSDPSDDLHGQVVPEQVTSDASHFVALGDHGIADWQGRAHFVERVTFQDTRWSSLMRRFEVVSVPSAVATPLLLNPTVVATLAAFLAVFVSMARYMARRSPFQRVPIDHTPMLVRTESGELVEMEAAVEETVFTYSDTME